MNSCQRRLTSHPAEETLPKRFFPIFEGDGCHGFTANALTIWRNFDCKFHRFRAFLGIARGPQMNTAQIEALQEAHLAFDRAVDIFGEAGERDLDECRTRAAMALIAFGISELREIWSKQRVHSAVIGLMGRVYQTA